MADPRPALRRLRRDLRELAQSEQPNFAAEPLESDFFTWRANVLCPTDPTVAIHLEFKFPVSAVKISLLRAQFSSADFDFHFRSLNLIFIFVR
eukprot:SAG11_NODE_15371_length_580_cov_1.158004_1_plen_93_part_00